MRFAVELKKGKGVWVFVSDLVTGKYINDQEHRQRYSNLRTALKGSLIGKDGQKFIESDGSKNYRLSTHPDFVTFDRKKLITHPDPDMVNLVSKK